MTATASVTRRAVVGAGLAALAVVPLSGCSSVGSWVRFFTRRRAQISRTKQEWQADGAITGIQIKISADVVTVRAGKSDTVCVSYYDTEDDPIYMLNVDGEVLTIGNARNINWANESFTEGEMVIEVPKGALDDLGLDVGAGDIDLERLSVKTVSVEAAAGDIDIADVTADSLSISAAAGDIDIEQSTIAELTIDAAAGNIDLEQVDATDIAIDAAAGDVDAELIGAKDEYTITTSHIFGDSNILEQKGTGARTLKLDVAAGDVDVTFLG